ncbi:MAG: exosortase [Terriglobia bacterium]|nr:MAG: exosortase [Terriglobia bacterium]
MIPALETPTTTRRLPWVELAWFGALLLASYAPILARLVRQWDHDPDMSHGFFVPFITAFLIWRRRDELAALKTRPNWWGLLVVLYGTAQLYVATLGAELFLARTAFVITVFGAVWMLGGTLMVRRLFFPLALLFFMIPIPAVIYNRITFPLQFLASHLAGDALAFLGLPVLREGNILELPNQRLSVVEACSGIRSLLTLTYLSLVYGHFFEKNHWIRAALFVSTVPIAILANASRVTVTGLITEWKPEWAEGFFHTAQGWVIFMVSLFSLIVLHQILMRLSAPKGAHP